MFHNILLTYFFKRREVIFIIQNQTKSMTFITLSDG